VEIADLGRLLRARRSAAGRTIASVAADAGLSVPYIANLENGRGNPTLSALAALAAALGTSLRLDLSGDGIPPPEEVPASLAQFARGDRFAAEAARLAATTHVPEPAARDRLITAMTAMAALTPRPLTDLDWHRVLDVAVLLTRE
jgi:transcriptional regulator with XRE-family HTH domain